MWEVEKKCSHGYDTEKIVIFYVPEQVAILVTERKLMLIIFMINIKFVILKIILKGANLCKECSNYNNIMRG